MRNLLIFMCLVALFMFGRGEGCSFNFGGVKGQGPVKSETRALSAFDEISIDLSGTVIVEQASDFRVEISAQENLLPILKTEVESDGNLRIYFSKDVWMSGDLTVRVFAPNLDGVHLNGSANVDVNLPIRGEQLKLDVNGSGNIKVAQADFAKVACDINGSGHLQVEGKASDLNADISGSGHVDASRLMAENGNADISGSGGVQCNVARQLRANVSGSGFVEYKGSPQVDSEVSGSGSVRAAN